MNNANFYLMGERRKVTPSRNRTSNNGPFINVQQYFSNENNLRNLSPNKLNTTRKPLVSPSGQLLQKRLSEDLSRGFGRQKCSNHQEKTAEFVVRSEDEVLGYCQKCAIHLASRGFNVTKLQPQQSKQQLPKQVNPLQSSKHEGKPQFQQIKQFLTTLNIVEENHISKINKLNLLQSHYESQIKVTEKFYDKLVKTIVQIRNDHLDDLIKEGEKHTQIADIQIGHLQENLENIKLFRNDIENGVDQILDDASLTQMNFQSILNFYRNKVGLFQHRCQEIDDFFQEVIQYKSAFLTKRLEQIQEYIINGWNQNDIIQQPKTKPLQQIKKPTSKTIRNIVQIGEKLSKEESEKGPCRRLFYQEEVEKAEIGTSPQFKNI